MLVSMLFLRNAYQVNLNLPQVFLLIIDLKIAIKMSVSMLFLRDAYQVNLILPPLFLLIIT